MFKARRLWITAPLPSQPFRRTSDYPINYMVSGYLQALHLTIQPPTFLWDMDHMPGSHSPPSPWLPGRAFLGALAHSPLMFFPSWECIKSSRMEDLMHSHEEKLAQWRAAFQKGPPWLTMGRGQAESLNPHKSGSKLDNPCRYPLIVWE